jgi:hypothetical protein
MTATTTDPDTHTSVRTQTTRDRDPWWAVPLATWLASRLAMVILTFAVAWEVQTNKVGAVPSFTSLWDRWDVVLLRKAAQFGWFGSGSDPHQAVDFPGLPLAMRLVHPVVGSWVMAGIVVSAVAGIATCLCLYRLAADDEPAGTAVRDSVAGRRAVLYLIVFPYAVFLFAGYSEGLFLAFATASWLAARRERWLLATVLAAGAAATRVTGLAFAVGLAVEYLVSRRRAAVAAGGGGASSGPLWTSNGLRGLIDRRAPLLALPALPVLAYLVYLHRNTGRWDAYSQAMRLGWGRSFATPLDGWRTTWGQAFTRGAPTNIAWYWRAELLAVVVGVVLAIVLAVGRRWGEATYIGLNVVILGTTNYYGGGARAVLVWFPLYLLLARLAQRRAWLHGMFVWTMAPLMAAIAVAFIGGAWID